MFERLLIPDTVNYMIAGYVVITAAIALYLGILTLRWKKAARAYQLYSQEPDQD